LPRAIGLDRTCKVKIKRDGFRLVATIYKAVKLHYGLILSEWINRVKLIFENEGW